MCRWICQKYDCGMAQITEREEAIFKHDFAKFDKDGNGTLVWNNMVMLPAYALHAGRGRV